MTVASGKVIFRRQVVAVVRNAIGLFLLLLLAIAVWGAATAKAENAAVQSDTDIVANLGMLQGDEEGLTPAYLAKPTMRIQAAIMYLRLKGLEQAALAYKGTDNFEDAVQVGDSNKTIMAYLKAHPALGWAGTGNNKFDPLAVISAQQYYKVMLEALGYKQDADFAYDDVIAFAGKLGLHRAAGAASFHNADIATATVEALQTAVKGGKKLVETLAEAGSLDAAKAAALTYPRIELQTSVTASAYGTFMTDGKGMSLYFFAKDPADPNACQAACLANWPVFYAEQLQVPAALNAASFGVLTRADGTKQTTYNGWPLYYFVKDKAPGDVNGEASGKVWYLAKPYSVTFAAYGALGNFLVDGSGRTLYYFDKDVSGISACSGQCLTNWPAFYAETPNVPAGLAASDFGTLIRPDGTPQTTYRGFPLYYFAKDTKAGMTTGQAVNNVWYVIDPAKFHGAMSMPMPTTTEPKPTDQPQPAATGSAHSIYMENYAFSESVITVSVGDTVTFTNKDEDAMHNAVAVDGSFSTRLLAAGESATITLTKAGEFDYYCEPHKPFMKAKIIVK